MSGVDSRVVTMKFDNAGFEKAAATTMGTLGKLKESLNFGTAAKAAYSSLGGLSGILSKMGLKNPFSTTQKGIQDLGGEAGRFNLNSMDNAIGGVSKTWLAMATVALTAISNITSKVISSAGQWVKGFTFQPILDGLHEYQVNLQSIQTIQANTDQPLTKINASLNELNRYSDATIYNFSEMAKNIGTFTAAGVDLKTATSSIKGIANLAALSGSSSQQAATAMYQLSQAISSGRVGLQDWNSVVNAGMGGKKLQNALAQTAIAMGQIDKGAVKMVGPMHKLTIQGKSFRESITAKPGEKPWLSSEVLVNTLATLDGRFSKAALSQEKLANGTLKYKSAVEVTKHIEEERAKLEKKNGVKYTDKQFAALQKLSTSAFLAATQVKTLSQVFDVAKETIGSGWASTFQNIFGNFGEAKKTFTDLSNFINAFINKSSTARNNVLVGWKAMGGRRNLIDGIKASFNALVSVMKPLAQAFREIFPKKTANDLAVMTVSFKKFAQGLIIGKDTADKLKRTFAGVFAIFSIIGKVIGGVAHGFSSLFSAMGGGGGGFLNLTAGFGDMLVAFNNFLSKSGALNAFFGKLGSILSKPLLGLQKLAGALSSLFNGFSTSGLDKASGAFDKFGNSMGPLKKAGSLIGSIFGSIFKILSKAGSLIGSALGNLGDLIAHSINPDTFSQSLNVINTALLGGIVLMLKNFFSGKGANIDLSGGLFGNISKVLGSATGALKNMQTSIKADIIKKIAIALGILAAALFVLSSIPPGKLAKALGAMSLGFGVLIGVMAALIKVVGTVGAAQIYVISGAITKLATSMLILAIALKILASLNFGDMLRGLFGMAVMLKLVQKAMIPMAAASKGMARAAASLILLGIALNIMAVALKIFASMSWEEMAKGLTTTAVLLGTLAVVMKRMPKDIFRQAAAILVLSVALNALAIAMKIFASMNWEEMKKGFVGVIGSIAGIAIAMRLMPKNMVAQAAALVLVAGALTVIAGAIKIMGGMSWESIGKGMVVLGGAMLILAIGLNSMGPMALLGAAALVVAAGALSILAPVLLALGAMPWDNIIKALTALAGTFVLLGVAGALMGPVIPVLIGLAAVILVMGAGLALAGAGALAFSAAFAVLLAAGTAGIQLIGQWITSLVSAIPAIMVGLAKGLVAFAKTIAAAGPAFVAAMSRIIGSMLDAVIRNVPKFGRMLTVMINTGVRVLSNAVPKLINLGFKLIISFLNAVSRNVGKITNIAASIVIKFMKAIGDKAPALADSAVRMIIKFINAVTRAINTHSHELGVAGGKLGIAMVKGMASGISGAAGAIKDAALTAARKAFDAVKHFFKIGSPSKLWRDEIGYRLPQGAALGIDDGAHLPIKSIEDMGSNAMSAMKRTMSGVSDALKVDGNINPVISPVLDLTALTKEANKMSGILAQAPIFPDVSYRMASSIAADAQRVKDEADAKSSGDDKPPETREVTFTQINNSPKAISPVEHYRQTKNLLSLAKEALDA